MSMEGAVYLIFGEDEYAVSTKVKEVVDSVVPPDNRALGLEVVDGAVETVETACQALSKCMEALQTVGFLGEGKAVWFRDVSFLSDTVVGKSDAVKPKVEMLAKIIEQGLPKGTVLVVSSPKVDKRYAFYKACKAAGKIHEFAMSEKPWQAAEQSRGRVCEMLRQTGLRMDEDALDVFLSRVGMDGRVVASELEKLAVFAGKAGVVKRRDVADLTSASRASLAWDIADAFGKKELGTALEVLRRLVFQKESPIGLIILLHGRIRDLLVFREALDRGWLRERKGYKGASFEWTTLPQEDEVRFSQQFNKDPRSTHPFRVGILAAQAKHFSQKDLRRCQEAVVAAHQKLVSSRVPQAIILELLLIRMLTPDS